MRDRVPFDHLTPLFPDEKFMLTARKAPKVYDNIAVRVVDLFSPIGKGQRGLIVAQPKNSGCSVCCCYSDGACSVAAVAERPAVQAAA